MTGTQDLDAMGEDELLAYAESCAEAARMAEVNLLRVAYQWAILHDPDRLDPAESALPGREKARLYGGAGTPEVCEFAAAELGVRIGRSTYAAAALMADALDLHHRHRQLWGRVEAGEVKASYARFVVAKTRDLTREQAAYVDAAVAESADGRIPWSRFEALVEAKVKAADPETARAKEEKASKATFAKKLRTEADGMGSFLVRADIADHRPARRLRHRQRGDPGRGHARGRPGHPPSPRRPPDGQPRCHPRDRHPRAAADRAALPAHLPRSRQRRRSPGSRGTARSPRPGSPVSSARAPGSRSPRSSTSKAKRPWMPTRSRTDIDRPCI